MPLFMYRKQALRKNTGYEIILLIGPEGGFSEQEIAMSERAGAQSCTLGKRILRSETAGAAALAMIQYELMDE